MKYLIAFFSILFFQTVSAQDNWTLDQTIEFLNTKASAAAGLQQDEGKPLYKATFQHSSIRKTENGVRIEIKWSCCETRQEHDIYEFNPADIVSLEEESDVVKTSQVQELYIRLPEDAGIWIYRGDSKRKSRHAYFHFKNDNEFEKVKAALLRLKTIYNTGLDKKSCDQIVFIADALNNKQAGNVIDWSRKQDSYGTNYYCKVSIKGFDELSANAIMGIYSISAIVTDSENSDNKTQYKQLKDLLKGCLPGYKMSEDTDDQYATATFTNSRYTNAATIRITWSQGKYVSVDISR